MRGLSRYRTEIVIPNDRVITLILPDDIPLGRATIVVKSLTMDSHDDDVEIGDDDQQDIEWWDDASEDAELE